MLVLALRVTFATPVSAYLALCHVVSHWLIAKGPRSTLVRSNPEKDKKKLSTPYWPRVKIQRRIDLLCWTTGWSFIMHLVLSPRQLSPFLTVKVTLDSCGHFSRHCVFPRNTYQFLHLRDLCKWPWPLTVVRMLCVSATLKHTTVQGQLFTFWIGTVTENWQLVMVSHKDAKLFLSFVKPACIKTTITKT